jgi:hypothetical protein
MENNIKTDFKKRRWEDVDRIYLAQHRGHWWVLVNTVPDLRVPMMWRISSLTEQSMRFSRTRLRGVNFRTQRVTILLCHNIPSAKKKNENSRRGAQEVQAHHFLEA